MLMCLQYLCMLWLFRLTKGPGDESLDLLGYRQELSRRNWNATLSIDQLLVVCKALFFLRTHEWSKTFVWIIWITIRSHLQLSDAVECVTKTLVNKCGLACMTTASNSGMDCNSLVRVAMPIAVELMDTMELFSINKQLEWVCWSITVCILRNNVFVWLVLYNKPNIYVPFLPAAPLMGASISTTTINK